LAKKWKIPAARISTSFAFSANVFDRQILDQKFRELILSESNRATHFLDRYAGSDGDFIFHREGLNIYPFPIEFEPCEDAIDERCFHAGRTAGEQLGFGSWRRPSHTNQPIVLVAPSTSFLQGPSYFKTCMAAFSDLPFHVVLSINDDTDETSLSPLPHNFELIKRTSYTKVLPHVDLVVCMGGTVTASEAAYHGVPMVITSLGIHELECLAGNLMRLGIGAHLSGADTSADALRRCVIEVLESAAIPNNLRRLQHAVRRQAGAEETANRIHDYLKEA
jgi:dTDP-L-oleandrosyltransferase